MYISYLKGWMAAPQTPDQKHQPSNNEFPSPILPHLTTWNMSKWPEHTHLHSSVNLGCEEPKYHSIFGHDVTQLVSVPGANMRQKRIVGSRWPVASIIKDHLSLINLRHLNQRTKHYTSQNISPSSANFPKTTSKNRRPRFPPPPRFSHLPHFSSHGRPGRNFSMTCASGGERISKVEGHARRNMAPPSGRRPSLAGCVGCGEFTCWMTNGRKSAFFDWKHHDSYSSSFMFIFIFIFIFIIIIIIIIEIGNWALQGGWCKDSASDLTR